MNRFFTSNPGLIHRRLLLLLALLLSTPPLFAEWREIATGVTFQNFSPNSPITYHVARIRLGSEGIRVIATRENQRGSTVTKFATATKALVAINGDYFDQKMAPVGPTVSPCGPWTQKAAQTKRNQALLVVGKGRAEIYPFADIPSELPTWSGSAISGWPMLVNGCRALTASELPGSDAFTRSPHARTAVGISKDKKTLYLVVVDGRKNEAAGVTLAALGEFMEEELGVCTALNLDGGGSSTMAVDGKLASKPTSGSERVVANHLAVVRTKNLASCLDPAIDPGTTLRMASADLWRDMDEIFGRTGVPSSGDLYKVTFPRSDLEWNVSTPDEDSERERALALVSTVVFKRSGDNVLFAGDLLLRDDEVSQVTAALREGDIRQINVHNHLLRQTPQPVYLHIAGEGPPSTVAHTIRKALDQTGTPSRTSTAATSQSNWPAGSITLIEQVLGRSGQASGRVEQFSIVRNEKITLRGVTVPPLLGASSLINFQPMPDQQSIVTGELLLTEAEIGPVTRELERGGFEVAEPHERLGDEQPRLFALHLWSYSDPATQAATLRAAIDRTNHVRVRQSTE